MGHPWLIMIWEDAERPLLQARLCQTIDCAVSSLIGFGFFFQFGSIDIFYWYHQNLLYICIKYLSSSIYMII